MHSSKWLNAAITILFCATLSVCILSAPIAHSQTTKITLPDFSLSGINKTIQLSQYAGKIVYLDFWASWCVPCKQSFPWMNAMQAKYATQGFTIIAINLDAKTEDAHHFLTKIPAQFDIAFDPKGDTAKQFKIKGMPSSVLIGRDGKIIHHHTGFKKNSAEELELIFAQALEKK